MPLSFVKLVLMGLPGEAVPELRFQWGPVTNKATPTLSQCGFQILSKVDKSSHQHLPFNHRGEKSFETSLLMSLVELGDY